MNNEKAADFICRPSLTSVIENLHPVFGTKRILKQLQKKDFLRQNTFQEFLDLEKIRVGYPNCTVTDDVSLNRVQRNVQDFSVFVIHRNLHILLIITVMIQKITVITVAHCLFRQIAKIGFHDNTPLLCSQLQMYYIFIFKFW